MWKRADIFLYHLFKTLGWKKGSEKRVEKQRAQINYSADKGGLFLDTSGYGCVCVCVLVGVCVGGVLQLYYWCSCAKGGSPIPVWVKVWQKGVQRFLRGAASALTRQPEQEGGWGFDSSTFTDRRRERERERKGGRKGGCCSCLGPITRREHRNISLHFSTHFYSSAQGRGWVFSFRGSERSLHVEALIPLLHSHTFMLPPL